MIKRTLAAVLFIAALVGSAFAQGGPGGPGPVPDPWTVNGPTISYSKGGVVIGPATGGGLGAGNLNISGNYFINGAPLAGTGTVTNVAAGTGMSFSAITSTGSVAIDKATNANAWGAVANKVVTSDVINSAGTPSSLTDASSISLDPTLGIDFTLLFTTHGGTRALANPATSMPAGRKGCIWVTQDGTGGEGLTLDTSWMTAGGSGLTLSTGANDMDLVCYAALDSTHILITVSQLNVKH